MRYKLFFAFVLMVIGLPVLAQDAERELFYAAMTSKDVDGVNRGLTMVRTSSLKEKEAYEGALLMKKAGLLKIPAEKLKAFRSGRSKFDPAINADMDNAEYHFLRLTIQEHAPRIVKYYKDIGTDKEYVQKGYKNLSPVVQKAILEYSKTSKVLQQGDL